MFNLKGRLKKYVKYLREEEKSKETIKKYVSDITKFINFLDKNGGEFSLTKSKVIEYKDYLQAIGNLDKTVNGKLSSLNAFFDFYNAKKLKVKLIKVQKDYFGSREKQLTNSDIRKLLDTCMKLGKDRLCMIIQVIANTGIRISELKYITVESLTYGKAKVKCKDKKRKVYLTPSLCNSLKIYCKKHNIKNGSIFITRNGNPVLRTNVWFEIKDLCEKAGVDKAKGFPHNFRHYFAVTFYNTTKDIDKLAALLCHTDINTTRIYTVEDEEAHIELIEKLDIPRIFMTKE